MELVIECLRLAVRNVVNKLMLRIKSCMRSVVDLIEVTATFTASIEERQNAVYDVYGKHRLFPAWAWSEIQFRLNNHANSITGFGCSS